MPKNASRAPAPRPSVAVARAERRILLLRGRRVLLDSDLSELYEVETRVFNQAVKRHEARFPADFRFQLTEVEARSLRSQIVISKIGRGGRRYLPHVFTQEGVAMLSSVLNSERAVQVNIGIMRAFVRLREVASTHAELARKLEAIEQRYDGQFRVVFQAIRRLVNPPIPARRRPIGFLSGRTEGPGSASARRRGA